MHTSTTHEKITSGLEKEITTGSGELAFRAQLFFEDKCFYAKLMSWEVHYEEVIRFWLFKLYS